MRVFLCTIALVAATTLGLAVPRALAADLCVGSDRGCFASVQQAVDAAHDGDVVHVGRGTFAGGITITKNLTIVGAGPEARGRARHREATVISGGGPVLTIGQAGAATEPTVTLSGLTITGGVNSTSPSALGGGIYVPQAANGGLGATVVVRDSLVAGNHASPATTVPSQVCPSCPFALGSGGGIDNAGTMTLERVVVRDNVAGSPVASDADGGGILNERGATLMLRDSDVSGNVARATTPNGRFAIGGGIFTRRASTLAIEHSVVSANTVHFATAFPSDIDMNAQAGGIKIGGDETTVVTIRDSAITGNAVVASSSGGGVIAFAGAIDDDGTLGLSTSVVTDNRVAATGVANVSVDGGALEIEGTAAIANVKLTGNSVLADAPNGEAVAQGGAVLTAAEDLVTISHSVIEGNAATSASSKGRVTAEGGGVLNGGALKLDGVHVTGNAARATGPAASAQGGGIWNGMLPDGPAVSLTLANSAVAGNSPDECFGC